MMRSRRTEMFVRLMLVVFTTYCDFVYSRTEDGKCVKLSVGLCRDLRYNMTLIPNVKMNVDTMEEASRHLSEFSPLFKVNCYANLQFFICNMFLPICHTINGNPTPVYPCRHVCEAARRGCEPLMKKYSFEWPEVLRCDYLSSIDQRNALCGSPPVIKPTRKTTTAVQATKKPWVETFEKFPQDINALIKNLTRADWVKLAKMFGIDPDGKFNKIELICMRMKHDYVIKEENKKKYCVPKCKANVLYTAADKKFATVWISTWSIICFLSTMLTVTTYLIDHKRFKYPERPIIFLSFCYNLYSIGYLIRVFGGYDSVVCESTNGAKHILTHGMSITSCTLVFVFLYFFGMASALWWVILSLTWFLSAALKWGHEAIEKYSSLFHAISWTVPTIQTIVALVTRKVDTDRLSGLCYIGNSSSGDLLLFVALPLLIYLLLGTIFLSMGFIALIKIRKILRKERNTNKFERLMLRIGVFSVLYSVPASIVVGCFIHEFNRLKTLEKKAENLLPCLQDNRCAASFQPRAEVFYLRYFMLLVVGVTSGVWIWSSKTLGSWKKFYSNHFGGAGNSEEKKQLYVSQQSNRAHRRASNEAINQLNVNSTSVNPSAAITSLHGSNTNMSPQQQHIFMPPPTRFFFPVPQNPADFMQAHNVAIYQAKMENSSRGFTVTPISNLSDDNNSQFTFDPNNHNYIKPIDNIVTPPPSKNYSRSNSSGHHSNLTRNGCVEPPGSPPKGISTRSQYSTNGENL